MDDLTPQVMHKLVFTILVHGLPEAQTSLALDILREALNHSNSQVRELAVVAIADLPVPSAKRVQLLGRALSDPMARVRRRAARLLGDFGPNALAVLPELIRGLRDPDLSVRRDCAGSVGRLGPAAQASASSLVALFAEPDTRTRVVAATALKRIGRTALPALLRGLHAQDPEVRARCAGVIGHLCPDDPTVADALRQAQTDPNSDVRQAAAVALEFISVPVVMMVPA